MTLALTVLFDIGASVLQAASIYCFLYATWRFNLSGSDLNCRRVSHTITYATGWPYNERRGARHLVDSSIPNVTTTSISTRSSPLAVRASPTSAAAADQQALSGSVWKLLAAITSMAWRDLISAQVDRALSVEACQAKCQATRDCQFFSYHVDRPDKRCRLCKDDTHDTRVRKCFSSAERAADPTLHECYWGPKYCRRDDLGTRPDGKREPILSFREPRAT